MCICSKIDHPLILLKKLVMWINEVEFIWMWLLFLHWQTLSHTYILCIVRFRCFIMESSFLLGIKLSLPVTISFLSDLQNDLCLENSEIVE